MTNGLEYYNACWCAGTGCGGHLVLAPAKLDTTGWTPVGWQGPAQHTFIAACAGFHEPGPCSPSQAPVRVESGDSA